MRTTSSLESFNAVLNKSIAKRANLFKFIPRLRLHESRKADEMYHLAHDILSPVQFMRRKKKDQIRDEKIKHLTSKYLEGNITNQKIQSFLEEVAADKYADLEDYYDSSLDSSTETSDSDVTEEIEDEL